MKKLESTFVNMTVVLTLFALVAAGALGAVYSVTEEPIAMAQVAKQQEAIKVVLPDFTELSEADTVNGLAVYKAYNGGSFVGAAVESQETGFNGPIRVMVGFDADGTIVNYSVLEQKETPGLGTKMVDWFKGEKADIRGMNPTDANMTVTKDGGDVDAITAATISSRAFLRCVNAAYAAFSEANGAAAKSDAVSGATAQTDSQAAVQDTINVEPIDSAAVNAAAQSEK